MKYEWKVSFSIELTEDDMKIIANDYFTQTVHEQDILFETTFDDLLLDAIETYCEDYYMYHCSEQETSRPDFVKAMMVYDFYNYMANHKEEYGEMLINNYQYFLLKKTELYRDVTEDEE